MPSKSKKTTMPVVPAPSVPSLAELAKLGAKDQCARFAERATVNQRAFAEMGKLHHLISGSLKKGQTIYGELRKLGVKDSTISNASYASKMIELVKAGHVSEMQYDAFTFADCLAISRVTGDKSARKLSGEEVQAVIAASPDTFDAEFESIYTTGLTVAEEVAQAEKRRKLEAVRIIQDRINETISELDDVLSEFEDEPQGFGIPPVDKDSLDTAVWEAHHDAVKALLAGANQALAAARAKAELEAQQAAAASAATTPPAATGPAPSAPAAPVVDSTEETTGVTATATTEPTVSETTPSAPVVVESNAESNDTRPSNVEQMPVDPDADLEAVLGDLDNLCLEVDGMSIAAKKAVFAKLNEFMAHLDAAINTPVAAAA